MRVKNLDFNSCIDQDGEMELGMLSAKRMHYTYLNKSDATEIIQHLLTKFYNVRPTVADILNARKQLGER